MNNKTRITFFIIIFLAFALRFIKLGSLPPSLTWDEVSWGYNAFTLGTDGKDEFGKVVPLQYLESFGDFKPPVYAYLDVLPVKIFGLNEFAARFPSAVAGVLTVIFSYFLIKRMFPSKHLVKILGVSIDPAIVTAFILAISPWHILLSRAAFEANVATLFIVLGVYLFFISVEKKKWYLLLSILSFVLSAYTFNTARIVAPILLAVLFVVHYKKFWNKKEIIVASVIFGFIICLPLLLFLKSPQAKLRFQEVNIFSDVSIIERVNQQHENNNNASWSRVIQNRRFAYGAEYLKHYFDNLSPSFLFIKGDGNPKFSIQDVGQMYLWEIPFFIAGILYLFRKREGKWWLVPIWILVGIAPAATARETPHALRIAVTLPLFQFLTAYGIFQILLQIRNYPIKKYLVAMNLGLFFIVLCNFAYFIHNYFFHYSREFSGEWQYGYKEAVLYTESVKNKYDQIYFTEELGRPYMYVLFYDGSRVEEVKKLDDFLQKTDFQIPVTLVKHISNKGFSSAVNTGAFSEESDYVFFLNSDAVPEGNFIDRLISNFDKNPSLFAVGCMDKSFEPEGIVLRGRGIGMWKRGILIHKKGEIDGGTDTFWVSGGSSMVDTKKFKNIRGFDTIFNPFYWEDIDLSYRAQKAGYEIMFDKSCIVEHRHEEGAIKKHYKKNKINTTAYRNQFIFLWKTISDPAMVFQHIAWLPFHIMKAIFRGDTAFLKGFFLALLKFPDIIEKIKQQKKYFILSDKSIIFKTS